MRRPCCDGPDPNKGVWSKKEDQKLIDCTRTRGEGYSRRSLSQDTGLSGCGKSCQLRWINYLKQANFREEEDDLIIRLHALLGNRWSLIAGRLPGRTDNEVKNYWKSHLKGKLRSMGIDPHNHRISQILPIGSGSSTTFGVSGNHEGEDCRGVLSDAESCIEDSSSRMLPDLNLDLNISASHSDFFRAEIMQQHEDLRFPLECGNTTLPTLLLFR